MSESSPNEAEMEHKLRNMQQQKQALQGLLARAANELEQLSEANCSSEAKESAEETARKLRRAAGS
jgi:uncharacterized protein YukE